MKFDIITIFPNICDSYCNESILKRAKERGLIDIVVHNLRDYTEDKHKKVDDTPYGGGAGMVLKVNPIFKAVTAVKQSTANNQQLTSNTDDLNSNQQTAEGAQESSETTRTILFSAKGKRFVQADAVRLAKYDRLIFVCGRYEGVDERVAEHVVDEELSIGDFVLTGGELPAMMVVDAVARLLPEVLGNTDSAVYESHTDEGVLEHPQYTKPEEFNGWRVPEVLLSGHHRDIETWRKHTSKKA
ncbi:MAG: tRNA (guanosine(37)-N1)-methyltransferase TrmD [Candidatus Moranbacteria bacterium]|nr:tRNA (guanosine(37)-N1)-methyltransferase TrmD [Candidatus Moranbacteria bacterium]